MTIQWCILSEPLAGRKLHPYGDNHAFAINANASTLSVHHCLFAPQGRALHGDVAKGLIKNRELRLAKIECLRSEPPGTRARLNKHKFRRAAEILPHLHELSRQETGKDGMHVDTCVVVCETLGLRFAVIAVDRMVEAFAHVVRERKRAEAANAVGK